MGNKPEISHPEYGLNQAPQWYVDMYADVADPARRNLSAMITVMDEAAGNVTAALQTAGMWKDTIFIFSTDVSPLSELPLPALCNVFSDAVQFLTNGDCVLVEQNGGPLPTSSNYPLFGGKVLHTIQTSGLPKQLSFSL